jgi:hypothetical protein
VVEIGATHQNGGTDGSRTTTRQEISQRSSAVGSKTRRGIACQCPAMKNGRCRLHGEMSAGPKTGVRIEAIRRARTKHDSRSEMARHRLCSEARSDRATHGADKQLEQPADGGLESSTNGRVASCPTKRRWLLGRGNPGYIHRITEGSLCRDLVSGIKTYVFHFNEHTLNDGTGGTRKEFDMRQRRGAKSFFFNDLNFLETRISAD